MVNLPAEISSANSMKDVARALGVCTMTVSRALRNDPRISASTTERIKRACERWNYRPDPRLSAMMSRVRRRGSTRYVETIAVVRMMPQDDTGAPLLTERRAMVGLRARAEEQGFRIDEFTWWPHRTKVAAMNRILFSRGLRGVALLVIGDPPADVAEFYPHFACATIDATIPVLNHTHADHFADMTLAMERLAALGYRRPAFYRLERVRKWTADLWQGAFTLRALEQGSFEPQRLHVAARFDPADLVAWYRACRPDVILSHIPACDIIRVLQEAGHSVPAEIGVATVEWMPDRTECAGVDQRSEDLGSVVVDLITRQLAFNEKGVPEFAKKVTVQGAWHDGPSLGLVPAAQPGRRRRKP